MRWFENISILIVVCLVSGCVGGGAVKAPVSSAMQMDRVETKSSSATDIPLENPGFESTNNSRSGRPEGWQVMQHAGPKSYEFSIDAETRHSGTQALRIKNIGKEPYGLAQQKISVKSFAGQTIAFSAWLKTEGVHGQGAGLTLRALNGSTILLYDFMDDRRLVGTQDWKRYTVTMKLPERTTDLEVGVMLQGEGTVWVDDIELSRKD